MSQETDILYVVLAMQTGLITKDQLAECGAIWANDRKKSLPSILDAKGFLKPQAKKALEAMVEAQIAQSGDPGKSMASLMMCDEVRRILGELSPASADGGAIPRLKSGESEPAEDRDANLRNAFSSGARTVIEPSQTLPAEGSSRIAGLRSTEGEKYEFKTELGRGGLGRVVEAMDTDFGREVAVKMMLPGPKSAPAVDRFLLEGRIAGRLPHPNIVPVYEIGALRAGGRESPYFTMAKIRGLDLGKILSAVQRESWESSECRVSGVENPEEGAHTGLSVPNTPRFLQGAGENPRVEYTRTRLLRIFIHVCNAIAYAHAQGVIHRDLKPANIMVGGYGEVYVVDWGLAKIVRVTDSPEPDQHDFPSRQADQHDEGGGYTDGRFKH